jgi:uncharacterized protein (DUF305 family)
MQHQEAVDLATDALAKSNDPQAVSRRCAMLHFVSTCCNTEQHGATVDVATDALAKSNDPQAVSAAPLRVSAWVGRWVGARDCGL